MSRPYSLRDCCNHLLLSVAPQGLPGLGQYLAFLHLLTTTLKFIVQPRSNDLLHPNLSNPSECSTHERSPCSSWHSGYCTPGGQASCSHYQWAQPNTFLSSFFICNLIVDLTSFTLSISFSSYVHMIRNLPSLTSRPRANIRGICFCTE